MEVWSTGGLARRRVSPSNTTNPDACNFVLRFSECKGILFSEFKGILSSLIPRDSIHQNRLSLFAHQVCNLHTTTLLPLGSLISPRRDPSRTQALQIGPGYIELSLGKAGLNAAVPPGATPPKSRVSTKCGHSENQNRLSFFPGSQSRLFCPHHGTWLHFLSREEFNTSFFLASSTRVGIRTLLVGATIYTRFGAKKDGILAGLETVTGPFWSYGLFWRVTGFLPRVCIVIYEVY